MTKSAKYQENEVYEELWSLATAVRDACYSAAITAYENASIDGLCHDGAWECALVAIKAINFEAVITTVISERQGMPR